MTERPIRLMHRDARMTAMAAERKTAKEIAAAESVGLATVYSLIRGKDGKPDRYQVMVGRKYVGTFSSTEAALAARAAYLESQTSTQQDPATA